MTVVDDGLPNSATVNGVRPSCAASLTTYGDGHDLRLTADLRRTHRVRLIRDVFAPENPVLRESIGSRPALVVASPSVYRLHVRKIRAYFDSGFGKQDTHFMVLARTESSKSFEAVLEVCERATAVGLRRTSPIVAVGGGVCIDICGVAAALHRRGIPHINVPTTLVGLVDAGIGTKNAVNHCGRKSALGSFHPPEHSLLDPAFLATLPRRHLLNGTAEIAKLAIVRDGRLFRLLREHGRKLVDSGFRLPGPGNEVIRRAVYGMLDELSRNLYEIGDLRRSVDFGHTFSPHVEVASGHTVLHGEAVAIDIALSAEIACELGLLSGDERDRIVELLCELGLALTWPGLSVDGLWGSLANIVQHRDDELHLVVPTAIGNCTFVRQDSISPKLLRHCLNQLAERERTARLTRRSMQRRTR